MKNTEFVKRLKKVATDYKTTYMWGTWGNKVTDDLITKKVKQYPKNYSAARQKELRAMVGKGVWAFDCCGLIKGILWGWVGDDSKKNGGAVYASNGVPDSGADSTFKKCKEQSSDFSDIEIGEAVWKEGHIGVYIGNGLAVESTNSWDRCVQITACNCSKAGYKRRDWKKHGKLPYIEYAADSKPISGSGLKIGDIVTFTGTRHYQSSEKGAKSLSCKGGKAEITAINKKGAQPYHLVRVPGGGSTVYGWVKESDIKEASEGKWTPAVGDIVNYHGSVHYTSANGTTARKCTGGKAKISQIYKLGKSKHPYHLVRVPDSGATVYGWVDAGTFTKA